MNRLILLIMSCFLWAAKTDAHPGVGVVMDSKGNVFYTDLDHVWKISPDGELSIAVKNVHTHELYMDENDDLYGEHEWYEGEATDKWGNSVWCLSSTGELEQAIAPVEGFLSDNTLVRDMKGNTYWPEKSGKREMLKTTKLANGQSSLFTEHLFRNIRWMYFSKSDKNLYVVDHLKLKRVKPNGEVTVVADNLKENAPPYAGVADHHYVYSPWTDSDKNVYVAVYGARKVKKINADGSIKTVFESEKGWSPCGGMTDPDGSRWIMEFSERNKTRIIKISPDGKQTVFQA